MRSEREKERNEREGAREREMKWKEKMINFYDGNHLDKPNNDARERKRERKRMKRRGRRRLRLEK